MDMHPVAKPVLLISFAVLSQTRCMFLIIAELGMSALEVGSTAPVSVQICRELAGLPVWQIRSGQMVTLDAGCFLEASQEAGESAIMRTSIPCPPSHLRMPSAHMSGA